MNIFIAKLSGNTKGEHLLELFGKYGEVKSAKVIFDKQTGNSKRYGFVEMENEQEALKAIGELNESDFMNSKIVVKVAEIRSEVQQRPRKSNQNSFNRRKQ